MQTSSVFLYKLLVFVLTGSLLSPLSRVAQMAAIAAETQPVPASHLYQQPSPMIAPPIGVLILEDGTPVKLKLQETLSSKTAKANDVIAFVVMEDVKLKNTVVITRGATAKGVVIAAKRGKMLGRKGKLTIAVKDVTLAKGAQVPLRATQSKGGGLSAGTIAASVILTPLFLLMGGRNVTYEAGTELTAFIDGNFALDRSF